MSHGKNNNKKKLVVTRWFINFDSYKVIKITVKVIKYLHKFCIGILFKDFMMWPKWQSSKKNH